ncbi:MAG: penicillin-binding protein [Oscillospiraceae bacterium]|nr:penicillin-binding protein [Oscillospiraceae bacterium]
MKKISRRGIAVLLLTLVLTAGMVLFLFTWTQNAKDWLLFSGSPHVYRDGRPALTQVKDRDGETLLSYSPALAYGDTPLRRAATMHLLGDRSGNIPPAFSQEYLLPLTGYDAINGLAGAGERVLTLTISARVQETALQALGNHKGTVAVYNYETGEILCAVTSPTFDPDSPPDLTTDLTGAYDGVYLNRFLHGRYTPGSIFKLVTTTAAMEYVPDIFARTFICEGEMEFGVDKVICAGNHGEVDVKTALAKSCNCAFAQIALLVGAENLTKTAESLGLTSTFTVDGITTAKGQFDLSADAPVNVAWAGIGQYTDLVNPYAFLRFMGTIAGGGQGAEPYFVRRAGSYMAKTTLTPQLFSQETANGLTAFMQNNVNTIYGAWQFPDIEVCAKSGTAEVGEGLLPHATFAGFCANDAFPLAFVVVAENAGAGSDICAPIAAKVLHACVEELAR